MKTGLTPLVYICATVGLVAGPDDYERVYWDKKDARKVISKASYLDAGSTGEILLSAFTHRKDHTYGIWLTDDVCWAIGVIVQEEERRTDEEKQEIFEDCRAFSKDYYTIYVSASVFVHFNGFMGHAPDVPNIQHRPGQIFLQQRKKKENFIRPARFDDPPSYFVHLESSWSIMTDVDVNRDVLIRFPRDENLLEGQKDIDLELRQGRNRQRLKFSLKKLRADKGRLANL